MPFRLPPLLLAWCKPLVHSLLTLLMVMVVTFALLRALPGGPFDKDKRLPPAVMEQLEAKYHLNAPVWQQLLAYSGNVLRGDLGPSYKYTSRTVQEVMSEALPPTLILGALSLLLGCSAGMSVALLPWLLPARAQQTKAALDTLASTLGLASLSAPSFVVAGSLVLLFALELRWLPAARLTNPMDAILPTLALATVPFGYTVLWVRKALWQQAGQGYLQVKHALGIQANQITLNHQWRNALLPWMSLMGPLAAGLLTGSFAVETIFAIPGVGKLFVLSVIDRDYPVVMGITLLYSVLLIALNLVSESLLRWLDPRLRVEATP
ncbi:MAG: ABC transporter permease [Vampirovibrionales bacterium]|nr:ABC transporter permease [Vampirovibrionales bacterium]